MPTAYGEGMSTQHDTAATSVKYPTLTQAERDEVAAKDTALADLEARIAALVAERKALWAAKGRVFDRAALRDTTPEQVALTYRTTGRGYEDLRAIVRGLHPYLYDVTRFGMIGRPATLAAHIGLTQDWNDPAQVPALTAALLATAALIEPDGGMTLEVDAIDGSKNIDIDWQWYEHANGMHPVEILEDDCGETRSLLLGHTADGTRAVLLDQRRSYRYGRDGVVKAGTLAEVLTELFRICREDQTRDDEGRY